METSNRSGGRSFCLSPGLESSDGWTGTTSAEHGPMWSSPCFWKILVAPYGVYLYYLLWSFIPLCLIVWGTSLLYLWSGSCNKTQRFRYNPYEPQSRTGGRRMQISESESSQSNFVTSIGPYGAHNTAGETLFVLL